MLTDPDQGRRGMSVVVITIIITIWLSWWTHIR